MQRPSFRGTSGQGSPALLLPESAPVVGGLEAAPLSSDVARWDSAEGHRADTTTCTIWAWAANGLRGVCWGQPGVGGIQRR